MQQALRDSPVTCLAAACMLLWLIGVVFAPWLAPHDPQDLAAFDLADARLPPIGWPEGRWSHWLGTDDQGRDIFSAILFGARLSLMVGLASVLLSLAIGVPLGLAAGYLGGRVDALVMRLCDVMLSFPAILIALLIDGISRALWPRAHDAMAWLVLVLAIALSGWVPYARTVRGGAMVEQHKDYVLAARVTGVSRWRIMRRHVLPNVLGPVWVLATLQVASAILIEATLSFLGVGMPVTSPSLGTLVRIGNDFLFSGEWWIALWPGLALVTIAVSINLLGDAWRDALDPRLRT
jgi:peptide/nickel transport system permease protein